MSEMACLATAVAAGISGVLLVLGSAGSDIRVHGWKASNRFLRSYVGFLDAKLKAASPLSRAVAPILQNGTDVACYQLIIGGGLAFICVQLDLNAPAAFLLPSLLFIGGAYLPVIFLERLMRARTRKVSEELPGVMEIIALALEAGLSFDQAVDYVAEKVTGALAALLIKARSAIASGARRETAYRSIAKDGPAQLRQFLDTVLQAERQGKPVSASIIALADSVRVKQQLLLELRANRLPTTMLLPIFMFIVPPVLLVYLLPAIINLKNLSL